MDPTRNSPPAALKAAPPLARGWTPAQDTTSPSPSGSPARAGMDPRCPGCRSPCNGLPRSRGDGPECVQFAEVSPTAPPLARGWTLRHGAAGQRSDGSPARAGMDPDVGRLIRWKDRLPRSRGDGPITPPALTSPLEAPPLARGWTRPQAAGLAEAEGSPARAGMDPTAWRRPMPICRLPRSRGDGPPGMVIPRARRKAPPLARGWTLPLGASPAASLGSPARAGMHPSSCSTTRRLRWLPRSRGDGPLLVHRAGPQREAPPLARGWTPRQINGLRRESGSPARAGMDPREADMDCGRQRLPRSRGDGPASDTASRNPTEAPPLARGWTPWPNSPTARRQGSPARAGMAPSRRTREHVVPA